MRNSFLPGTDSGLLAWAKRFSAELNEDPALFGISIEQAEAIASLTAEYASAMLACDPAVRNRPSVSRKNTARTALKAAVRPLVSIIRGQAGVTDAQKVELGLTLRSGPTSQSAPDSAPSVAILSIRGRTARIQLRDINNAASRARPRGVDGAIIFAAVSKQSPEPAEAMFIAITNKTTLNVTLPGSAAPGQQVWIVARWFNRRKQLGPISRAVCTNVQFGGVMSLAA